MKIAVSSTGKDMISEVSSVFARCSYFIVVEVEDDKIKWVKTIKNENNSQSSGAGISTAQMMAKNNINAVVAGNIGPRAIDILRQFNIALYTTEGIIEDALRGVMEGKVNKIG